ncbi:MAG TPA: trypsin-like peptidase domain-containing protein [Mycobacterium sp.]|nr:trypsin-like peptidase domain-containing protein [Mycobacterium sp.]
MAQLQSSPRPSRTWPLLVTALVAVVALLAPAYLQTGPLLAFAQPGDPTQVSPAAAEQGMVKVHTTVDYQGVVGYGAGIVLTPDGVVLTNNHVIAGADTIDAVSVGSGQRYPAQLLGYDRTNDIAVIQLLGANGLPTAPIGDSNQVAVGEPVVSLGNASGNSSISREEGQVSALGQNIVAEDDLTGSAEQLSGLIGVAAPVRPGDSGGPLVNSAGQVIGVTVAASVNYKVGPTGKGFAIPINRAVAIANQIQSKTPSDTVHIGPPAMLGIGVATAQQRSKGVVVRDVIRGTPAEQAGLTRGDVITSLDGVALDNATTLTAVLDRHYPGDVIDMTWVDATGQQRIGKVQLATGPHG